MNHPHLPKPSYMKNLLDFSLFLMRGAQGCQSRDGDGGAAPPTLEEHGQKGHKGTL